MHAEHLHHCIHRRQHLHHRLPLRRLQPRDVIVPCLTIGCGEIAILLAVARQPAFWGLGLLQILCAINVFSGSSAAASDESIVGRGGGACDFSCGGGGGERGSVVLGGGGGELEVHGFWVLCFLGFPAPFSGLIVHLELGF
uniref:Uncharacterized protein MANES_17G124100 n=1 Tax=Rhizophora mucronata TaxID=61149 RepID=A0A2P2JFK5_RHIMU